MGYVRNAWYVASWADEIITNKPQGVMILEEPIVIWRDESGELHALEDRCVHRLAPLSLGRCEGTNLRCMYHGFLFNTEGTVIAIPGQDQIPSIARVKRYEVTERDGWVWVWMGQADLADETLIPAVNGPDNPRWTLKHGQLDYAAEARLINDNLTDFSHISFVHSKSFAVNEDFATAKSVVTLLDRGVRFQRWAENQPPAGMPDAPERFDVYLTYDYLVPGILSLTTKLYPVGTIKAHGHIDPPLGLEVVHMYSGQAVTPTGKKSTRYFFSNGAYNPADPDFVEFLWNVTLRAFAEDNIVIEGQQRIVDLDPDRRIMPAVGDKGTVLFNRVVDRLVRDEETCAVAA